MISETSKARRISFSADSVLAAVVQDADTTELARLLDAHGAEEVRVNQVNHVGLTALHHGVLSNNLDAVKLLLCAGADVDKQDVHGFSPLHTAAACGFTQVASLLLLFGADAFALTTRKELPIDLAREIGVVRLLTEEMRRRMHAEEYLGALVRSHARDCWYHAKRLTRIWLGELMCWLAARLWNNPNTLLDTDGAPGPPPVADKINIDIKAKPNSNSDGGASGTGSGNGSATTVVRRASLKKRNVNSPKLVLVDGDDKKL